MKISDIITLDVYQKRERIKTMFLLKEKTFLNEQVFRTVIEAPLIAKKAQPGQFVIVRVCEDGERIPLTISDYDRENGTITLVVQRIGVSSAKLLALEAGDEVEIDFNTGMIYNRTKGTEFKGQAFPEFMQKIIAAEGLVNYINQN